jgi:hypothetical protein
MFFGKTFILGCRVNLAGGKRLSEGEAPSALPPEWGKIPFQRLFEDGFRPYIRFVGKDKKMYIVLRKGNNEVSLGPFTNEKWNLLLSICPEDVRSRVKMPKVIEQGKPESVEQRRPKVATRTGFQVALGKLQQLPRSVTLDLKTLMYFEWARSKGFDGTLDDFINQVVQAYFLEHGLEPVILVKGVEESG